MTDRDHSGIHRLDEIISRVQTVMGIDDYDNQLIDSRDDVRWLLLELEATQLRLHEVVVELEIAETELIRCRQGLAAYEYAQLRQQRP